MKFTSSWLQEHIKVDISGKKLANILTNLGLEVESCKNLNDYFTKCMFVKLSILKNILMPID